LSGWLIVHISAPPGVDAKLVAAAVELSTRSTISSDALAMTKDSSVSRSAMVDTEDGKNCGVSTADDKTMFRADDDGRGGLSETPITVTPCSRAI
jgi:hypothetical protein